MPTTHCNSTSYTFNNGHDSPHQDTCRQNFTNESECGGSYYVDLGTSGDGYSWTNTSECGGSNFSDTTGCVNNRNFSNVEFYDHNDDPFYDHDDVPFYDHDDTPWYDHFDIPGQWYNHNDIPEETMGWLNCWCEGGEHNVRCEMCSHINEYCVNDYHINCTFYPTHHYHSWSGEDGGDEHESYMTWHEHTYSGGDGSDMGHDDISHYHDYDGSGSGHYDIEHEHYPSWNEAEGGYDKEFHYTTDHYHTYTGTGSGHNDISHVHIPHINFCNHTNV
jgi:hypothetical protein